MAQQERAGDAAGRDEGGFTYQSDGGEIAPMEAGAEALGTPDAGAGAAAPPESADLPAGAAHREGGDRAQRDFAYHSDAGELAEIERGTVLTEEGEGQARGDA